MGKGFGVKKDEQLGYILVLIPEANAYAANFSLDFDGSDEKFIGITNMLEEAQIWKTQKLAKQAIERYYGAFILEQLESNSEVGVNLKRLKRSPSGTLETEMIESLWFHRPL
ncbi:MAG: hypothetical protein HC866_05355 [Leptolyngbyaceae cyanobacterium RU_5_1]|nr:hypothetical protein [Leptolyngbyaceae cyanobacterium RU_5_1]